MNNLFRLLAAMLLLGALGCATNPLSPPETITPWSEIGMSDSPENPWWNQGVFYEIYVRSFRDSDGDRFGDIPGIIEKLDYLNDGDPQTNHDLGVSAIWLMPIQENTSGNLHGYHTEDYYSVEEDYGTHEDLRLLIEEAHKRGIRVIIDLVINHVSNTHPWFQDALQGPGSSYYDWFVWSDRILHQEGPWGQEVWHTPNGGQSYYFGIFNFLIPDLNYRNPEVTQEILEVSRYWLEDMGVDGFRIDASRHLIEDEEHIQDHPDTFQWYRDNYFPMYKEISQEKFIIGEQFAHPDRPEYQVAGEALDMSFDHFVRIALENSIKGGTAKPFYDEWVRILDQYPNGQFGTFLSNHDLDRFMSVLEEHFEQEEIAFAAYKASASLLLTLPGVPFLYYGEELGQRGQGKDDNKRRAMQWDNTPGNHGFTDAQRPYGAGFNQGATERNVENQSLDPNSILSLYRDLIQLRSSRESLQIGHTLLLPSSDPGLFAFLRYRENEYTLVIQNLSSETIGNPSIALWSGPFSQNTDVSLIVPSPDDNTIQVEPPEINPQGGLGIYSPLNQMEPFQTLVLDIQPN